MSAVLRFSVLLLVSEWEGCVALRSVTASLPGSDRIVATYWPPAAKEIPISTEQRAVK
jgi:hypothetical protein